MGCKWFFAEQATIPFVNPCCPMYLTLCGVTSRQWVKQMPLKLKYFSPNNPLPTYNYLSIWSWTRKVQKYRYVNKDTPLYRTFKPLQYFCNHYPLYTHELFLYGQYGWRVTSNLHVMNLNSYCSVMHCWMRAYQAIHHRLNMAKASRLMTAHKDEPTPFLILHIISWYILGIVDCCCEITFHIKAQLPIMNVICVSFLFHLELEYLLLRPNKRNFRCIEYHVSFYHFAKRDTWKCMHEHEYSVLKVMFISPDNPLARLELKAIEKIQGK